MEQLTLVSAKQMPLGKEHENVFLFQVIIKSFCSVKYGDVFIRFGEMTSNLSINDQVLIKHKGPQINQPYRSNFLLCTWILFLFAKTTLPLDKWIWILNW